MPFPSYAGATVPTQKPHRPYIGDVVRWIRLRYLRGISQAKFAEKIGVVATYVTMWETGNRALSARNASRIAERVARSGDDRRDLEDRLILGILRTMYPEQMWLVESRRLEPPPERRRTGLREEVLEACRLLGEPPVRYVAVSINAHDMYAEMLLEGTLDPTPQDVVLMATSFGADPKEWVRRFAPQRRKLSEREERLRLRREILEKILAGLRIAFGPEVLRELQRISDDQAWAFLDDPA